ncbi:HNH endonuclease [Clostridium lacusfryxellense]|uniref:HNH endonuclease n=1 Tax=Clostridium lacusfryxellense TaxID=205328 RepID=UPI001C0E4122|nr:HNH endonuclease [Clostridium lacusfryxellense]MBU3114717.1 HNH endonuclease [Clostridium lacusfryxellense]
MNFKEFNFKTTMPLTTYIINELHPFNFFENKNDEFLEKILVPNKKTLLHDYIEFIHEDELDYAIRKTGYESIIDNVIDTLLFYNIDYTDMTEEEENNIELKEEYYSQLIELYYKLTPIIVEEIFTILYMDKGLLKKFNESISKIIKDMKPDKYKIYLEKDGIVKRCTHLPKWLKNGVFFRDKGICQTCGKDLTCLISTDSKINYDYIIPLEKGGSNDPSNFQLTCKSCNTSKGVMLTTIKN